MNGTIAAGQGRIHRAERKLALMQTNLDRRGEGEALFYLACAYAAVNDYSNAIIHAEKSLPFLEEFKDSLFYKMQEKLAVWKSK